MGSIISKTQYERILGFIDSAKQEGARLVTGGGDEKKMLEQVNAVEYGLTASIWTNDLSTANRTATAVQAGFVWINEVSKHFLGAPFGGYKQSGIGREECFEEMLAYTQEKNIHIRLKPAKL